MTFNDLTLRSPPDLTGILPSRSQPWTQAPEPSQSSMRTFVDDSTASFHHENSRPSADLQFNPNAYNDEERPYPHLQQLHSPPYSHSEIALFNAPIDDPFSRGPWSPHDLPTLPAFAEPHPQERIEQFYLQASSNPIPTNLPQHANFTLASVGIAAPRPPPQGGSLTSNTTGYRTQPCANQPPFSNYSGTNRPPPPPGFTYGPLPDRQELQRRLQTSSVVVRNFPFLPIRYNRYHSLAKRSFCGYPRSSSSTPPTSPPNSIKPGRPEPLSQNTLTGVYVLLRPLHHFKSYQFPVHPFEISD